MIPVRCQSIKSVIYTRTTRSGAEIVNSLFGLIQFGSLFLCPKALKIKAFGHFVVFWYVQVEKTILCKT